MFTSNQTFLAGGILKDLRCTPHLREETRELEEEREIQLFNVVWKHGITLDSANTTISIRTEAASSLPSEPRHPKPRILSTSHLVSLVWICS